LVRRSFNEGDHWYAEASAKAASSILIPA